MKYVFIVFLFVCFFSACDEKSSGKNDNDSHISDSDSSTDSDLTDDADSIFEDEDEIVDEDIPVDDELDDETVSDADIDVETDADEVTDTEVDEETDADNTGCVDGETKTDVCGVDDSGSKPYICQKGEWIPNGVCTEPEECINNDTKSEEGTLFICKTGHWKIVRKTYQMGSATDENGNSIASDSNGNIFITGSTNGTLDSNIGLGGYDLFLIKFDSAGNKLWTKIYGTDSYDSAASLVVDSQNNVYIAGSTAGRFPGYNEGGGWADIFVMKLDNDGNSLWTYQLENKIPEQVRSITLDSYNNVYVTGSTFGALGENSSFGSEDAFLIKLNSNGTNLWIKQFGTSGGERGESVAADSSGNVYLTGTTDGVFDGETSAGSDDVFVMKFDVNGNISWRKQFGTAGLDMAFASAIDSSGNLFITGNTNGVLAGDSGFGYSDMFLRKYSSAGNILWTKQFGSAEDDSCSSIAIDSDSNIYLGCYTRGGLGGYLNQGEADILIVKYNADGTNLWFNQFGSNIYDFIYSIMVDSSDNIFITGGTTGAIDGLVNAGEQDIFFSILYAE